MNRLLNPLVLIIPIALAAPLAGCATHPEPSASRVSADSVRSFVAAESGFDAAVETADLAVRSGRLPASTSARVRALADTGHAYIVAGRAAVAAENSGHLVSETAAIIALVAQLTPLLKG